MNQPSTLTAPEATPRAPDPGEQLLTAVHAAWEAESLAELLHGFVNTNINNDWSVHDTERVFNGLRMLVERIGVVTAILPNLTRCEWGA